MCYRSVQGGVYTVINVVSVSDIATVMSSSSDCNGCCVQQGGLSEIQFCPGGYILQMPNNTLCIPERFSITSRLYRLNIYKEALSIASTRPQDITLYVKCM